MLRLILSLLRAQEGEAWIGAGEEPSQRLALSPSTRKLFSYVPQGNTMFSGTIAENMRNVKPEATDEEIVEALKLRVLRGAGTAAFDCARIASEITDSAVG